jgi:hypothetical protein
MHLSRATQTQLRRTRGAKVRCTGISARTENGRACSTRLTASVSGRGGGGHLSPAEAAAVMADSPKELRGPP